MAYSKQTWTNDESAVLDTKMTHIEQGIYDNSLAADKINPSGTATTTAEIEEGQINDVIGFKSLKLKGQTSQYTTTGVNLLPNNETSKTINGVTFTKNEDGSILVKGTATSNAQYDLLLPSANVSISAGDYYLNGCPSGGTSETYRLVIGVDDTLYGEYGTGRAVTLSAGILKSYIFIANGATVNNLLYKPMLVSGSTAKPYEKYSGGKASPNPDYPQEVKNVSGDNVIGISNKNINSSTLEVGNISNGANTTDTNVVRSKDYIMVTPNTAYVFGINGTANKVVVSMYDENKVFLTNEGANGYASSNGKFTTYSNAKYIRYRSYSADKSLFESGNIQIEKAHQLHLLWHIKEITLN